MGEVCHPLSDIHTSIAFSVKLSRLTLPAERVGAHSGQVTTFTHTRWRGISAVGSPTTDTVSSRLTTPGIGSASRTPRPRADGCTFELLACGASVSEARRRARAYLTARGCGLDACDTAALLVSELVTNAVRHTTSPTVICSVRRDGVRVRIEVEDHGNVGEGPVMRDSGTHEVNGRGLLLVDAVCDEWEVAPGRDGIGRIVRAVFRDETV
ncbi:ATP-binding protein [Streptomyces sp. NPDC008139]|uniref:ATP-binding protein n=1 Tax=Streptomyces sp. NPDC008139 TaxID=3364814 RepID=UPI0036E7DB1A